MRTFISSPVHWLHWMEALGSIGWICFIGWVGSIGSVNFLQSDFILNFFNSVWVLEKPAMSKNACKFVQSSKLNLRCETYVCSEDAYYTFGKGDENCHSVKRHQLIKAANNCDGNLYYRGKTITSKVDKFYWLAGKP